jgi:hypothetical protein
VVLAMLERQYSDDCDDYLKAQQRQELVGLIWSYTLALEQYVVHLRNQVNDLNIKQSQQQPYPDVQSDFRVRFFRDLPAYEEFMTTLDAEETELVLPD